MRQIALGAGNKTAHVERVTQSGSYRRITSGQPKTPNESGRWLRLPVLCVARSLMVISYVPIAARHAAVLAGESKLLTTITRAHLTCAGSAHLAIALGT